VFLQTLADQSQGLVHVAQLTMGVGKGNKGPAVRI
jgi:hypothetical protein